MMDGIALPAAASVFVAVYCGLHALVYGVLGPGEFGEEFDEDPVFMISIYCGGFAAGTMAAIIIISGADVGGMPASF